jgi:TolA-binding protein
MFRRLCVLILAAAPVVAFAAASKEMQELQRDVALLQEQVRQLQQSQDKQLAAITTLVEQAVEAANRANTAVAVIQSGFQQSVAQQETKVVGPVVGLSTRMDTLANNFSTLQQSVADLTSLTEKLQAQMTDLNNAVKVMQAPAPAPPPGAGAPAAAASATAAEPCPSYSKELYDDAQRDRQGGKLDISLQEFGKYLRCFGSTDLAPNAQYFIGTIHFAQADYPTSLQDFDAVLEKYSDNNKTPGALFYKGETLVKMGRKTDAQKEYRELIVRFPKDNLAAQACSRLTDLGYRCPAPAPAGHPAPKKRTATR